MTDRAVSMTRAKRALNDAKHQRVRAVITQIREQLVPGDVPDYTDVRCAGAQRVVANHRLQRVPVPRGAHERNATLNYRSVLARELTAKEAQLYLQARQQRRSRRPPTDGGAPKSV